MRCLFYISVILPIFCMCSFVYGSSHVVLEADFVDTDYPEGGTPATPTASKTFSFTLTVDTDPNEYYTIDAKLEGVTEWTGSCSNYVPTDADGNAIADAVGLDLKLKESDNGGWKWISDTHLQFEITTENNATPPNKVVVRCYDFGAYGKLKVSVTKNGAAYGSPAEGTVPIDLNNNRIADGWEKKHLFTINGASDLVNNGDDETGPGDTNKHPGDGWSVHDEYRGLIENKAAGHKRLNPREKDVMVCYKPPDNPEDEDDPDMEAYGLGNTPKFDNHKYTTVHPDFVSDPFAAVFAGNTVIQNLSQDIGWVNQYSTGTIRAWAIRIANGGESPKANKFGHTSGGSHPNIR